MQEHWRITHAQRLQAEEYQASRRYRSEVTDFKQIAGRRVCIVKGVVVWLIYFSIQINDMVTNRTFTINKIYIELSLELDTIVLSCFC